MSIVSKPIPTEYHFYMVSPDTVRSHWKETYKPLVERAMEYSPLAHETAHYVYEQIMASVFYMVQVQLGDKLHGIVVQQVIDGKEGRLLHIFALAGHDLDAWIDDYNDLLDHMAESLDCVGISLAGRAGWARKLKRLGYQLETITMQRGVNNERR